MVGIFSRVFIKIEFDRFNQAGEEHDRENDAEDEREENGVAHKFSITFYKKMTISLSRSFYVVLIFISGSLGAMADDGRKPIEVLSGGRSFDSFEAYTQFKTPSLVSAALTQDVSAAVFTQDVLGITSPLAQVLQDFQRSTPAGRPVCPPSGLAQALEQAADGKQGPLLLVADGDKVRIMELKPETKPGTNP